MRYWLMLKLPKVVDLQVDLYTVRQCTRSVDGRLTFPNISRAHRPTEGMYTYGGGAMTLFNAGSRSLATCLIEFGLFSPWSIISFESHFAESDLKLTLAEAPLNV